MPITIYYVDDHGQIQHAACVPATDEHIAAIRAAMERDGQEPIDPPVLVIPRF